MNCFKTFIETHEPISVVSTKSENLPQAILDASSKLHRKLLAKTTNLLFVGWNSNVLEHLEPIKNWNTPSSVSEALYVGDLTLPSNDKVFYVYRTEHMHDNYVFVVALSNGFKYITSQSGPLPSVDVEVDDKYPRDAMHTYISINVES